MANGTSGQRTPMVTRRTFLTGAAATAGVVLGSGLMVGIPTIWAQKLKGITLLQVGGSYSAIIDIARQATKDLGFKIDMQNATTDAESVKFSSDFAGAALLAKI
jgi:putative spermidine/putrescine transport system substrate-binding protein